MPVRFTNPLPLEAHVGGGKAASLALLQACGLRTPPGFVCTDALLRALLADGTANLTPEQVMNAPWPEDFIGELQARLQPFGSTTFAVRSSFAGEDDARALAAGVYESCVNVNAADVPAAVRKVLASALAPAALAYAQGHARPPLQAPVCVLVHPFVAGQAWGHAAAAAHNNVTVWVGNGTLSAVQTAELEHAVTGLALAHGACEIEWVHDGEAFVYLQWRPFTPATPAPPWRPSAQSRDATPVAPSDEWIWDVSHNPAPLSPAQQGLVALVQQVCDVGFDQELFGGYLFYRPRANRPAPAIDPAAIDERFTELQSRVDADLATLSAQPALEAALEVFCKHYTELVGTIGAAVKQGRQAFESFVSRHAPAAVNEIPWALQPQNSKAIERQHCLERVRTAADDQARAHAWHAYLQLFGDEPSLWDVCAPTLREQVRLTSMGNIDSGATRPRLDVAMLRAQAAIMRIRAALPASLHSELEVLHATGLACAARGEDDDWLYARLQAPVRRALLALGEDWAAQAILDQAEDVFFVPLPLVRDAAAQPQTPAGLRQAAAFGRAAYAAQMLNPPPTKAATGLRGHGTGGRVVGVVKLLRPGQGCNDSGAVLIAKSILPTELPLLSAAAFVVETGGPLDHVAAQARERGMPAVVGVAGATVVLHEGDLVLVDADAGVVVKLAHAT